MKKASEVRVAFIKACACAVVSFALRTSQSAFAADGFAGPTTVGGQGGPTVTVNNLTDFKNAVGQAGPLIVQVQGTISFPNQNVDVTSQKTILGLGTDCQLVGDLRMNGVSDIVVQNIFFSNPNPVPDPNVGPNDGLTIINGSHHIWVDHCTFSDCTDGQLDITHGCDFVTVSWCKFFYVTQTAHRNSSLVGHSDANAAEDTGKLHITYHHNWWSTLADQRMPRVRFGCVHVYNNYYSCSGNLYCVGVGDNCQILVENNYFDGINQAWRNMSSSAANQGLIHWNNGNVFANGSTEPTWAPNSTVCTPSYSYTPDDGSDVKSIVTQGAGAGRPIFFLDPTINALHFGTLELGDRSGQNLVIQNRGAAELIFTVEVTGGSDARFTFSDTPNTPGIGIRGPTTFTLPPSSLQPPYPEKTLRVIFDAATPPGGPYNGTLRFSGINDSSAASPRDIALDGSVAHKSIDVALVIDRSGSMNEPAGPVGSEAKYLSARRAAKIFIDTMDAIFHNLGDRATLIQFNTQADVLQSLQPVTSSEPAQPADTVPLFHSAIDGNLTPQGATSIAAGVLKAFDQLTDPARDVRAVFVVSDGKENTPAQTPTGPVSIADLSAPAGVKIHTLGIGAGGPQGNIDETKLQDLADRTGGKSTTTGVIGTMEQFTIEQFFLKTINAIVDGQMVVDPLYSIAPGAKQTTDVPIIAADHDVTFTMIYQNGTLPYRVIAPDQTEFPAASVPAGFSQRMVDSAYARILTLHLPAGQPQRYVGTWRLEITNPKSNALVNAESHSKNVSYSAAVSVRSNFRLVPQLSPGPTYVGDSIHIGAFVKEEGIPVVGALIDCSVKRPDGVTQDHLQLKDDGKHNDGAADDGEYGAIYTAFAPGPHDFYYHAAGTSKRGDAFTREDHLAREVIGRVPSGGDNVGGGQHGTGLSDSCCSAIVRLLRWLLVVAVMCLFAMIWCCRRNRG